VSALIVSGGDGAEILEAIDSPLDDIAALVGFGVKGGWTAAAGPFGKAMMTSILPLWADALDAPAPDRLPRLACSIGPIHPQPGWASPWSARAKPRNGDSVQYRLQLRHVTALTGRHQQRQRPAMAIDAYMDLAGPAASGMSQPLVPYGPLFSAWAKDLRAPAALRWALIWVESSAAPAQSICPAASAWACNCLRMRCQVPLRDQRT